VEWRLLRLSLSFKDDETLLVVKLLIDGTQYVVFVSRPSPMDCVRTFLRKFRDRTVALHLDKYA
jgi:hypothetical protein